MISNNVEEIIDGDKLFSSLLFIVGTQIRTMFFTVGKVICLVIDAALFTMREVISMVVGARFRSNHQSTSL